MAIEVIKRKKGKVYRVRYPQNGKRGSRCFDQYYDAVQFEKEAKTNRFMQVNDALTFAMAAEEWINNHSEVHKAALSVYNDRIA